MTDIWHNIDPTEAEISLRGLDSRLRELERALQNQASLLQAHPDSFAFQLANESLLKRQIDLTVERTALLKHRVAANADSEKKAC